MHGVLGKPGWFWMFVLEGLPAVAPSASSPFYRRITLGRLAFDRGRTPGVVTRLADEQRRPKPAASKRQ